MFTLKLAWRYAFSRSNRHRSATIVIMLGIAVGMLAIIIMLSLMNRLQSDLLDQVKSIESFHVQVTFPANESDARTVDDIVAALRGTPGVAQVYPQVNTQVLIQNPATNRSTTARLRIIDSSIWKTENPFSDRTHMVRGSYPTPLHIATGTALATKLSLALGDSINMTVLGAGKTVVLAPTTIAVTASGVFRTGLPEFDSSTLVTDLDPLVSTIGAKRIMYGLYLEDGYVDNSKQVLRSITETFPSATIRTWQQVNSAFYSALTLEKVLMYLFLFFMFIILAVNMKNASSRLLHVKQRELAILRAVGAQKTTATKVFLGQTIIITVLGETLGIIGGVYLGKYIGNVFSWLNSLQYLFTRRDNLLLAYPFTTEVKAMEVALIAISVLVLSLGFTYLGCRRLFRKEPMEMLYHD
ncbi:MAG TPA: hypothetical protein DHV69_05685 [Sphaerochaeta sp.]|jgi:lipoprotein-releasing system permease protein|nr:MAG: hypothetical protein A2Y31_01905 [Spirochaetes bacterium GWC2_52_13]OHD64575.1 MAG: hypothetical protein A2101_05500 [Spirochaetes bacterium GWF2_52_7]PKL12045.1 MAG: hypothetical protein CVV52_11600 [Spirochaetae bacterium HGW-Spirochaetae-8]PKL21677.1 MAG: hypothetical protein CVV48_06715 [Spirochaetae bacterium HGW-Spirochaetae-4]HCG62273.1 hypothetical protein [Sphaerochaeta sp.]